jgi:hypothetical protein
MRLILPDVEKSIMEYVKKNAEFDLFKRRTKRAKHLKDYTMFDCLREDFLSRSGQPILGDRALAHQNAWDFESIRRDLLTAGFSEIHSYFPTHGFFETLRYFETLSLFDDAPGNVTLS